MMWFFAILLVLVLGGIAVVAAGKGGPMVPAYDDRPDAVVPAEGDLTGADLRRVRFSLAFRGYRMSEVDALLDRLASERERPRFDSESETDFETETDAETVGHADARPTERSTGTDADTGTAASGDAVADAVDEPEEPAEVESRAAEPVADSAWRPAGSSSSDRGEG